MFKCHVLNIFCEHEPPKPHIKYVVVRFVYLQLNIEHGCLTQWLIHFIAGCLMKLCCVRRNSWFFGWSRFLLGLPANVFKLRDFLCNFSSQFKTAAPSIKYRYCYAFPFAFYNKCMCEIRKGRGVEHQEQCHLKPLPLTHVISTVPDWTHPIITLLTVATQFHMHRCIKNDCIKWHSTVFWTPTNV